MYVDFGAFRKSRTLYKWKCVWCELLVALFDFILVCFFVPQFIYAKKLISTWRFAGNWHRVRKGARAQTHTHFTRRGNLQRVSISNVEAFQFEWFCSPFFFLLNCKFSFYFVNVNYVRHTRAKPCVDDIPNNASASAASTGCCHSTFALGKCIKLCFMSLKFRRHLPLWIVLCCMFLSGQVCHSRNWNWRKQIW